MSGCSGSNEPLCNSKCPLIIDSNPFRKIELVFSLLQNSRSISKENIFVNILVTPKFSTLKIHQKKMLSSPVTKKRSHILESVKTSANRAISQERQNYSGILQNIGISLTQTIQLTFDKKSSNLISASSKTPLNVPTASSLCSGTTVIISLLPLFLANFT